MFIDIVGFIIQIRSVVRTTEHFGGFVLTFPHIRPLPAVSSVFCRAPAPFMFSCNALRSSGSKFSTCPARNHQHPLPRRCFRAPPPRPAHSRLRRCTRGAEVAAHGPRGRRSSSGE